MHHEEEPSVEEILESIKKVIARDNRDGAAQLREDRQRAGVMQKAAHASPESEDEENEDEILDLDAESMMIDLEDDSVDFESPLVAEGARTSMRESLAALAMLAEPGAQPQIVRSGETSLEGLVREMLRPMLAEWLDKNLPALVEKLVAAEIARIAGKRG